MSCCNSCAHNGPCENKRQRLPPSPLRSPGRLPNFTGFDAYPYATLEPAPFNGNSGSHGGFYYQGPFGARYTTSYDMGHQHTVDIPDSAFGAVGPNFRRNVHMVTEALGVAVAAPMLWWASGETNNPRARAALRALSVAMAATDGALLASYANDMYQARK